MCVISQETLLWNNRCHSKAKRDTSQNRAERAICTYCRPHFVGLQKHGCYMVVGVPPHAVLGFSGVQT